MPLRRKTNQYRSAEGSRAARGRTAPDFSPVGEGEQSASYGHMGQPGYNIRMRSRWLVAVTIVSVVAVFSLALYRRFRIHPLETAPKPNSAYIVSALNTKCDPRHGLAYDRVVLLRTTLDPSVIKINTEDVQLNQLGKDLTDIFRTRTERIVYVLQDAGPDGNASAELARMVAQMPVIDRVCVVDLKHPPAWYPPPFCCPHPMS